MIVKFMHLTAILAGIALGSGPSTDEQDAIQLLLEAAVAASLAIEGPSRGKDERDDDENDDSDLLLDEGSDNGGETSDEIDEADVPSHRSRVGLETTDLSATEERQRKTREFVEANPFLEGRALLHGLNEYIGGSYGKTSLHGWVREARISLGHVVKSKLSVAEARRRSEIVDSHVSQNPSLPDARLAELIEDQLIAEQIPMRRLRLAITPSITKSRRRFNFPTEGGPTTINWTLRMSLIEGFVKDNLDCTVSSMIEHIKQLLRASSVKEVSDVPLFDAVYRTKRNLIAARRASLEHTGTITTTLTPSTTTAPTTTTTTVHDPQGSDDDSASGKRRRIVPNKEDYLSAPRAKHEKAVRDQEVCEYIGAHPEFTDPELFTGLNAHLGTTASRSTLRRWIYQAREELCPVAPRSVPLHIRRRDELIDENVFANPTLSHDAMTEPLVALLAAEKLPSVAKGSLRNLIRDSWRRLGKLASGQPRGTTYADRKAIVEAFIQEHIGWTPVRIIEALQPLLDTHNLTVTRSALYRSIQGIKARIALSGPIPESDIGATFTTTMVVPDVAAVEPGVAPSANVVGGASRRRGQKRRASVKRVRTAENDEKWKEDEEDEDDEVDVGTFNDVATVPHVSSV